MISGLGMLTKTTLFSRNRIWGCCDPQLLPSESLRTWVSLLCRKGMCSLLGSARATTICSRNDSDLLM